MIISFSLTEKEFLSGKKTCTRRSWSKEQMQKWLSAWKNEKLVHDAWNKLPYVPGAKKIGRIKLSCRPYWERLREMPESDLEAEGGMCKTKGEFFSLIGKKPDEIIAVIRFGPLV
jgi:hypothetical protein